MKILGLEIKRQKSQKTDFVNKSDKKPLRINKLDKQIIDKIVNQFKDKSRKDIKKWRKALLMAEHPEKPRRHFLQDIYKDLGTDGHLKSLIRLRKYTTLNTAFYITDDNDKLNEDATRFLNKKWFYDFLGIALDSIFYGYTLVEFESFGDKSANLHIIPRRNVVPEQKIVIPDLTKDEYISYDDDYFANWLIEIGDTGELGILNDIVPNLIWKRNVGQSWADFTEKFGIPMITAETTAYDDETIDKIDYMLSQIGEASRGVFPQGTTINFREADRTDAFQSYEHFIKYNKEEISVAIVGGTMITNDGSSRSQSEVHERNLDEKIAQADKRDLAFLINDYLLPLLRNQGYNFIGENDQFVFAKEHNLKLNEYWKIVKDIIGEYEVDEKWLSDTFFVPITGKKKRQNLQPIAQLLIDVENITLPDYPEQTTSDDFVAAGNPRLKALKKIKDDLAKDIWEHKNTLPKSAMLIAQEAMHLLDGLITGWGEQRIEAGWNQPDHLMLAMMEYNLFEFSASKTEARLAAMSQLLIDKDKKQIRSFNAFKKEAEKLTKNFDENWLRTEYNLSIATGQNAASYARFIAEKDTVTSFVQYQTAGDDKVRSEHQLLDGKIFNLSDKEAMRLWPPNGYGCRCEMVQYVGDTKGKVSKGKDWVPKMPEKFFKGFDFNRGDLKQVFERKQFYSTDGKLLQKINDLKYTDYGLKSWKEIAKNKPELKLDKTITGKNVKELFTVSGKDQKGNEFMQFKDYLNRTIGLFKQTFTTHTKGHYLNKSELRHRLFPFITDALNQPDEVWLSDSKIKTKWELRYIKFYNNKAIIIETELNLNMGIELKTWHLLKIDDKKRKGLLINNKPL